jgi:sterol desaturase/sphingolipid hydroxylase (fatty acid hydroxylase superfamily)
MNLLEYFKTLGWLEAVPVFLAENLLVVLLALGFGYLLQVLFGRSRAMGPVQRPISRQEIRLAAYTLLINTVVTYAGFVLWRTGFITIRENFSWRILLDFVVLFLGMDLLMYVFHYVIHQTVLYRWIHALHHEYPEPQPIDLFVLHPLETFGFGGLWLLLMAVYPANFLAIFAYLTVNVLFGVVGHSAVEPFPTAWERAPLLRYIGSSGFHFQHHQSDQHNFGFYTSIWDRIFGTFASSPAIKKRPH